ncbi:MAG: PDZ domain-containing protein [Candidatus Gastranaerophilales bacterium]|nr:PDZ domain-containing protein [Candidatus Gastranaerophilales bacterium]
MFQYTKKLILIAFFIGVFAYFAGFFYRNFIPDNSISYNLGVGLQIGQNDFGKNFLIIKDVVKNSPACKAGLQKGDIINSVNGHSVDNIEALKKEISLQEDNKFELNIFRGRQTKVFWVKISNK